MSESELTESDQVADLADQTSVPQTEHTDPLIPPIPIQDQLQNFTDNLLTDNVEANMSAALVNEENEGNADDHNSQSIEKEEDNPIQTENINQLDNTDNTNDNNDNNNNNNNNNNGAIENKQNKKLEPQLPPLHNLKTFQENNNNLEDNNNNNMNNNNNKALYESNRNTVKSPPLPRPTRNHHRPPNTARADQFRRSWCFPKIEAPTPEEQKIINRALSGQNISGLTENDYDILIVHLGQLRKQIAVEHKYRDGERVNAALLHAEQCRQEVLRKEAEREMAAEFARERNQFEIVRQEFDNETEKLLKELAEKHKGQLRDMIELHNKQQTDLHNLWMSQRKLRQYNRSSNALTILRRQHAHLLVQNRFKEAEIVQQEITSLTAEELAEGHKCHQRDYEAAREILLTKQREEVGFLENASAVEVAVLSQRRGRLRRALENREKRIDTIKEPEKASSSTTSTNAVKHRNYRATGDENGKDEKNLMARQSKMMMPSSKMTRKELGGSDVAILELPPLDNKRQVSKRK